MFLFLRVILSRFIVVLSLPAFAMGLGVIAWTVRRDSTGQVFFHQYRRGKDHRVFRMWKFRTMIPEAEDLRPGLNVQNEATGFLFKMTNDPRETRLGRRLRVTGLDELPQLWNVLKGEMSLVGPRPLPIEDIHEEALRQDPVRWALWQKRQSVRPGITGLWQWRASDHHSFDEMLALDCEYVDRQSLWFDLQIMSGTIVKMTLGFRASLRSRVTPLSMSAKPELSRYEKELIP